MALCQFFLHMLTDKLVRAYAADKQHIMYLIRRCTIAQHACKGFAQRNLHA